MPFVNRVRVSKGSEHRWLNPSRPYHAWAIFLLALAASGVYLSSGPVVLAASTSFYVSPAGSDSNAGTYKSPWRTLQKAANTAPAGATVYLRTGTFGPFVMRRSGTSSAPITFTAYGNDTPVVDGNKALAYTIEVVGAKYLRFSKLTIRGGWADGYAGAGITTENSSYIEIRNNVIVNNKSWGVRLYNSDHVTVDNNEVAKNAIGIHVNLSGEGTVITNNRVHDNNKLIVSTPCSQNCHDDVGGEGIALVKSTGHVTVSGNLVWANRAVSSDWGYDGGAFSVYGASNWTIRDNVTWNNRNVIETGTDPAQTPCDNNTFVRNLNYAATTVDQTVGLVIRCASNTLIANNTFVGMQSFVFDITNNQGTWGGSIAGLRILNNIISAPSEAYAIETWPLPSSVVIDYNLVNRTVPGSIGSVIGMGGTSALSTFRTWTGYETHGRMGQPEFLDPANADYHLGSNSPAIDHGCSIPGITDGYRGSAPDIGRYEY